MNKDELLKIYSAYLPYDLEFEAFGRRGKINEIQLKPDFVLGLDIDSNVRHFYPDSGLPILYDLSYLTKEIEHEGERIIPMVYFIKKTSLFDLSKCTFEVYEDDGEVYVNAHDGDRVIDSIFYDGNIFWSSKLLDIHEGYRPANPQHTWQEMLLHLHFNVFNLPESEYINKAN